MVRLRSTSNSLLDALQALHASMGAATATAILVVSLFCSGWIYWQGFLTPYPLSDLWARPLLDLRRLSSSDPSAPASQLISYLGLGALYWLAWRAAQRAAGRAAWAVVVAGCVTFAILLLWMFPFGAADIFDNIMHGRVLGVYGANPFLYPPNAFPDDPFLPYVAWGSAASAYGPGWELLAALVARWAGNGVIENVLAFKLLAGLFLCAAAGLVALILRRMAPERALAGVVLLAWNPVILVETFGNGHNDMAMVVWILAAVWAVSHRHFVLAVVALVLGMLFKYIPLLMLPTVGLLALRDLPGPQARSRFLLLSGSVSLLLVVAAYAPFWEGIQILTLSRRAQMFTTSLPALLLALLEPQFGAHVAGLRISQAAAGITAGFAIWQGVRALQDRSWLSFPRAAFAILIFYLLLTCLWFQHWYVLWPLSLAALLPPGHAARLAALFGFVALSKGLIFEPLWLWQKPLPPMAWREVRLGPAVLAVPWLYLLLAAWHRRRQQRNSATANSGNGAL